MSRYSNEQLTRWKREINPGPVISSRMKLTRENSEYVGLCPFHKEKTPSFKVYKMDDGVWGYKCFGCGANGNVFQFIEKFDKVSFTKAVKTVLDIAGVDEDGVVPENSMPVETAAEKKEFSTFPFSEYAPLVKALERSPEGQAWLIKRGITMETARQFKIGFVQNVGDISPSHLWRDKGWVLFPTLSADEMTVTAVKYRSLVGKKEVVNDKQVSGILRAPNTATSLYNIQTVRPDDDVWLVEGEPDTLVLAQAGLIAVGLPSADYKPTKDERAVLSSAKRIFLAGDTDKIGIAVMEAMQARLGANYIIRWDNHKDANDVLTNECGNDTAKFAALVEDLKTKATTVKDKVSSKEHPTPDVRVAVLRTASDVQTKNVKWLWQNRIPLGKISLFAGNPDNGKSLVTTDVAARVTTGRNFPDATNTLPLSDVLMLVAEDDIDDTCVPRLIAARADLQRVHFLEGLRSTTKDEVDEVRLDTDIPRIEDELKNNKNIRLIIIDPISSYLGDVKMVDEQHSRSDVLQPLKRLAAKYNVAIVMVMHLNKKDGLDAINRVGGAMAFVGVSRSSWLFTRDVVSEEEEEATAQHVDADDTFSMTRVKNNLAQSKTGLSFKIKALLVELQDGEKDFKPYVTWGGAVVKSAETALDRRGKHPGGRPKGSSDKMDVAVCWLERALQKGAREADELMNRARADENISRSLLYEAAKKIGVVKKDGRWSLPPMNGTSDADSEPSEVPIHIGGELVQ